MSKKEITEDVVPEAVNDVVPEAVNDPAQLKHYRVQISVPALYVRKGPGKNFETIATISDQEFKYLIVDESAGEGASMWGKLKTGGWISLDYVK